MVEKMESLRVGLSVRRTAETKVEKMVEKMVDLKVESMVVLWDIQLAELKAASRE